MKKVKDVKRFANALIRNVGIDSAPQTINELQALNALMLKSKEFKSLLFNPQFTTNEREGVLKQLAAKLKLSDYTIKFVVPFRIRGYSRTPGYNKVCDTTLFRKEKEGQGSRYDPDRDKERTGRISEIIPEKADRQGC